MYVYIYSHACMCILRHSRSHIYPYECVSITYFRLKWSYTFVYLHIYVPRSKHIHPYICVSITYTCASIYSYGHLLKMIAPAHCLHLPPAPPSPPLSLRLLLLKLVSPPSFPRSATPRVGRGAGTAAIPPPQTCRCALVRALILRFESHVSDTLIMCA